MTINERAKEFAQDNAKDNNLQLVAHAYHCGAVDQQNIDIERAWQWMRNHIKLIGSEMELHSQFVKAMKDEVTAER